MAIQGFDRQEFEGKLKAVLSPTEPIRSAEFLRGREQKLEDIRRAFVSSGRNVFIYGDRGVGKTSVAQTAAFEHQSSDQKPVLLTCDTESSFYRIARNLASALSGRNPLTPKTVTQTKAAIGWTPFLSAEIQRSIESGNIPEINSINEAVSIIDYAARLHSKAPIAIIDEFERIKSPECRMLFADFIKQLGDQSVPLKLIFCGVGGSLDDLLDSHHSCYRYLASVGLERLGFDGRFEIIDAAMAAFRLAIDDTTRYRIAVISDGFPHYIHLVCEKVLWEVFSDKDGTARVLPQHFTAGISAAAQDIEPKLRTIYEKAVRKYSGDYEEVLWAVADDKELSRRSTEVYWSYERIMSTWPGSQKLTRDRFNQRMNALKQPACGEILKATRQGWYSFSENIVRGYVRLRAQERGVELEVDHQLLQRRFSGPHLSTTPNTYTRK